MLCCLQVSAAERGDVNGDNTVDVSDINIVINEILGKGGIYSADVNQDGTIDVSDINVVINIVLGKDKPKDTHEYVDLGLPGGVLWATCNVGADKPEDYGLYFAWGETVGYAKDEFHVFSWSEYKWVIPGDYDWQYATKYTTADGKIEGCWYNGDTYIGTTVDGVIYKELTALLPEDDAATANWGEGWRMPTVQEFKDLYSSKYTSSKWETVNGVKGRMITSKSNGNSIFLPATGFRNGWNLINDGVLGNYWSSELYLNNSSNACDLMVKSAIAGTLNGYRCNGETVRAVRVAAE